MDNFVISPDAHIGYVHLNIKDFDQSITFYRDYLGFSLKHREENQVFFSTDAHGEDLIILSELPDAQPKPRGTTGLYHFAIRLPDRKALAESLQHLLKKRWPLQGAADHVVSEAVYLADPDGNGIEIYTDRPRQEWDWKDGEVVMATDPLDVDGLLSEASQDPAHWVGIHPDTGIGHIHLHVSDLARAEKFYRGVLGLEVTQSSYPGALFLSAGGYHHHVGLNIWAGRGAPPPPQNAVGLQAFLLEVPDPDWRLKLLNRVQEAGIPVEGFPHHDYAQRVLIHDPAGNGVAI